MDEATDHGTETDVADEPSHDEQDDDDVEQVVHVDPVFIWSLGPAFMPDPSAVWLCTMNSMMVPLGGVNIPTLWGDISLWPVHTSIPRFRAWWGGSALAVIRKVVSSWPLHTPIPGRGRSAGR